jgi:superfamily II DNA/RNA helicase
MPNGLLSHAQSIREIQFPDLWQHRALEALKQGMDVVVQAPTGAGKTYIFEKFIQDYPVGKAIYTVPTRALANDKRLEWEKRKWNVGLCTGDLHVNLQAPIVVATLETQLNTLLQGNGPNLLVVDEYQMMGDPQRGTHYEMAIAFAPPHTQLLLLSGTVGNPDQIGKWLRQLGRRCEIIIQTERPVPQDEVHIEDTSDHREMSNTGLDARLIKRALKSGYGPILAFAPKRQATESLARKLAEILPDEKPLLLSKDQQALAGRKLASLLKKRIAFHHSGLNYQQRAGLIEPLAKAGELNVVVATMGLSSGINFSLRSVYVTDREYRTSEQYCRVRPDELMQMFGRAGRRGLDDCGYILTHTGKPRLSEARLIHLRRADSLDWPALIGQLNWAVEHGKEPQSHLKKVLSRLFSTQPPDIGFATFNPVTLPEIATDTKWVHQSYREMLNSENEWERQRAPQKTTLSQTWIHHRGQWNPAIEIPSFLSKMGEGIVERRNTSHNKPPTACWCKGVPLARIGNNSKEGELVLSRWLIRKWTETFAHEPLSRQKWTLDRLEKVIVPQLSLLCKGAQFLELKMRKDQLYALLDYSDFSVFAHLDSFGKYLMEPKTRIVEEEIPLHYFGRDTGSSIQRQHTPLEAWHLLGLIDSNFKPTRRGRIFSFFHHGEGLAIAAALEDPTYSLDALVLDLSNLRAGHRFNVHETYSSRLGSLCRRIYRYATYSGYLNKGLPVNYGDGASEVLQVLIQAPQRRREFLNDELHHGDIERIQTEWQSLLRQCQCAPELDWDRWQAFQTAVQKQIDTLP